MSEEESENSKRPMFGARYLEDPSNVFHHNVWDNIKWDSDQEEAARKKVEKQAEHKIPEEMKERLKMKTEHCWDKFYNFHQNRFFKDRHWLFTEFPELGVDMKKAETPLRVFPPGVERSDVASVESVVESDHSESVVGVAGGLETEQSNHSESVAGLRGGLEKVALNCGVDVKQQKNYLEIGCGVGNTVFPILEYNIDPKLFVYCCDFSKNAIEILKSHSDYDQKRCNAFVCDVTKDDWKTPFPASSIDITTLIFVLSAIHPQRMQHVVDQVYQYLRPGGLVLFRDYGRYDMAQLRFKEGQMMEDNFYARKDGTFVYFFTQEEVREMFCRSGFVEELSHVDRRLQVNRSRQLKMYRVWVQAKFRKPLSS